MTGPGFMSTLSSSKAYILRYTALKEHSSHYLCEILPAKCVWGGGGEVVLIKAWCTLMTLQPLWNQTKPGAGPHGGHFTTQLSDALHSRF